MATLNQLATRVANHIGEPFNHELKERIKDSYRFYRAERIRQSIEKNGIDDSLKVSYCADLELVDSGDDCLKVIGCEILRTVNKVVKPVRYKSDEPFTYVGAIDGTISYLYSDLASIGYMNYLPNIGQAIYYYYENDYIFIKGSNKVDRIRIQSVPANLESLMTLCNGDCWNDDMEYPIPEDMIESITLEIMKLYASIKQHDIEIPVDDKSQAPTQEVRQ